MIHRTIRGLARSFLGLALACGALMSAGGASAQTYFYAAIVGTDRDPTREPDRDYVFAMSNTSMEDARYIACGHYDDKRGYASISSPQHYPSCMAKTPMTEWVNPWDNSVWKISVRTLECKNTRYFAMADGTDDRSYKSYIACGKATRAEAVNTVMDLCKKEFPKCRVAVSAFGDGSFGGVKGVGLANKPECWGKDAQIDDSFDPGWGARMLNTCKDLAGQLAKLKAQGK